MSIGLIQPQTQAEWQAARQLLEEYVASLQLDLSFQDIGHELVHLSSEYAPPVGAFLLAEEKGSCLGCVGVRRFEESVGEIKRLYTVPAARRWGLGRQLAHGAIEAGRRLGYRRLRLDTLPSMAAAHALYASFGFRPIAPYRFNPVEGAAFMELELR